jgi:hypothetical protein
MRLQSSPLIQQAARRQHCVPDRAKRQLLVASEVLSIEPGKVRKLRQAGEQPSFRTAAISGWELQRRKGMWE